MPELQTLAWVFAAGAVLGAGFFGGLWWTVRRGFASTQPALWFMGSLALRMGITLYGFYLIGADDWHRWLAALVGFILARFVVQRLTRDILPEIVAGERHAS